jgi:hypothetical protein
VVAARAAGAPAVRRSRAVFEAIDQECRRQGAKLCILVVGPVANYTAKNGESPLARIMANWGLEIPVIDVAIKARARPDHQSLTFPVDGHLNEAGHAYIAQEAAPYLQAFLAGTGRTALRPRDQTPDMGRTSAVIHSSWQAARIAGKITTNDGQTGIRERASCFRSSIILTRRFAIRPGL